MVLSRNAIGAATPMRGFPACGVKVSRIKTIEIERFIQRHQDALLHKLTDPWQIDRDDVVPARLAFGVAQDLLVQAIDGKGALMDLGAERLLELPLQSVHHHESGVAMHQHPHAAGQLQRFRQNLKWRYRAGSHVGTAVIVVTGVGPASR